jgi:hypothetical protein
MGTELKIVSGKVYSRCNDGEKSSFEQYNTHKSKVFDDIWKIFRKNKETAGNPPDLPNSYEFFNDTPKVRGLAIIAKINSILKTMHDEVDKGTVIPDLGEKIDQELDTLKKMLDLPFGLAEMIDRKGELFSGAENNIDLSFGSIKPMTIEFAKFGFWQVFTKNLHLIGASCIKKFEKEIEAEELQVEFYSFQCDSLFVHEAEKSLPRCHCDWSYNDERTRLRTLMRKIIITTKQVQTVQLRAAEQQSYSFQLLQQQQAQLHAIQQQQYGGATTNWNIGIAYRPPDSIFNISAGYQQGKANIQISMVPDEQASLLGATGFTAGVGPGNLGLSLNLNI